MIVAYYPDRYWQVCDRCGIKGYNTEMVKTWDGLIVHRKTCFDGPRSVLDFPPPLRPERQTVPDPRPENDLYVVHYLLTEDGGVLLTEDSEKILRYWPGEE